MNEILKYKILKLAGNVLKYGVLIAFTAICLIPFFWVWSSALKTRMEIFLNPFGLPTSINFSNLVEAWHVGRFNRYFVNSVIITVPSVALVLVLSSMTGFALAKLKFLGRDGFFGMLMLGLTLPFQAVMIPLYFTISSMGLLNTHIGVILPMIAFGLPFGVFFMRAFFRDLPNELIDSARVDGCNDVQIFTRIMGPLAKPAMTTLLIFQFMMSWNNFIMPLLFLHRESLRPLTLGLMFFQGRYTSDYHLIFAGITIITLPIVALYVVFQRQFISGLTAGAIKH